MITNKKNKTKNIITANFVVYKNTLYELHCYIFNEHAKVIILEY